MESTLFSELLIAGILRGGMYVLMALGLSLVFGVMKIPNFAHGQLYMLGAYFGFFASAVWGLPSIWCIVVAALGGFLAGAVIDRVVFLPLRKRSREDWILNSFLITAGLSTVLENTIQYTFGADYKGVLRLFEGNLSFMGVNISMDRLIAFVIAMVSISVFWLFLKKTKTGNAIRAVSEHETGAMLMGIDLKKIYTLTFALSCMLNAIAGAALLSITPAYPTMGLKPMMKSWFVVILVGLGNIEATIVGGLMVGLIETVTSYTLGVAWQEVVCLSIIVLILVFKPSGLFGKTFKV